MGDLKDASPAGDAKADNETKSPEAVDVEAGKGVEPGQDKQLALSAQMASLLLANPLYSLPQCVRRRVLALKNLQVRHLNTEVEFFKELHQLEMKYEKLFEPLYEKRTAIITGAVNPTDEECDFKSEKDAEASEELEKLNELKKETEASEDKKDETDIKGIPDFWLTAFKNAPALADMIEEYDEPILQHLTHVRAETSFEPMSFNLEFHFSPNEYFTNSVLTKYYEMRCTPDESDLFSFEGPEIVKCRGCPIDWKKGKNVTVKTIKKKQKHKARGAVRTVTKTVQNDSFFNFFTPPYVPDNEEDIDEEVQGILNNDFEMGNIIKDRIIPHAVLFFTGENLVDDDFEDEEDEDDEEEYDEDEDEESEEDDESSNRKKSRGQTGGTTPQAPPECKQQ